MMKRLPILLCVLMLAGCGADKWFTEDSKVPLKGPRLSVLELQKGLSPDPALQGAPVTLPAAWVNQFWPQTGGYPNHAMGQLALPAHVKEVWSESIGSGGGSRTPLVAGPIVAEGMVFTIDTEGQVTAFDSANGRRKWRQSSIPRGEEDTGALGGGLAYASAKLFVTNGYKNLLAINPATGAVLWKANLPAVARSAPSVADDKVYVITLDNRLLAFSAADGAPLWNYAGVAEETNLLGAATVAADSTLAVLPLSSGELLGLRPENGQVVWEDNLSAVRRMGAMTSIADIRALPVIDQGAVFAVSYSGRMAVLDQVTGKRLWQREVGSAETPWVAGDTVFLITTEQQLVAFTRQGGEIRWNVQLPAYSDKDRQDPVVWTGPVLAGGRLFMASSGGILLEIDPSSGKTFKSTQLGAGVTIPPIVASNMLFVLQQNGTLAAFK